MQRDDLPGALMNLDLALQRHELARWRDRHIAAAGAMLNAHAIGARAKLEEQLEQASVLDSLWDPGGFANNRIDMLMTATLKPALADFLAVAAEELLALDPRFLRLGEALKRSDILALPEAAAPKAEPGNEPAKTMPPPEQREAGWFARIPATVASHASSLADFAAETAESLLQDKIGLRNRLRTAASQRITQQWMGETGQPRPVLAQLIAIVEEANHAARTELL